MLIWKRELDIYGKVRFLKGEEDFIPFRYQGQYYDKETKLCYNRFRYYSPETGLYISQDPIELAGNNPNFYAYVFDSNICSFTSLRYRISWTETGLILKNR